MFYKWLDTHLNDCTDCDICIVHTNSHNVLSLLTSDFTLYYIQLHREFKSILSYTETVSSLMNSWPEWKEKLIKLSKLESKTRPNIKKIIDVLENEDNNESEGKYISYYIHVHSY